MEYEHRYNVKNQVCRTNSGFLKAVAAALDKAIIMTSL